MKNLALRANDRNIDILNAIILQINKQCQRRSHKDISATTSANQFHLRQFSYINFIYFVVAIWSL